MSANTFEEAMRNLRPLDDEGDLWSVYLNYILGGNARGADIINKMVEHFTGPLEGKRVLDIGCGYGGVCIAAAKAGAEAVGLEVGEYELKYHGLNLKDNEVDDKVTVHGGDATDMDFMRSLGQFDLVICDNVIEHVDDTRRLIYNISQSMKPNARCYITAPNAGSIGQVISECHNREFGLSLLNRFDAQELYTHRGHAGRYSVGDYFDFDQYISMFHGNGLHAMNIVPVDLDESHIDIALGKASEISSVKSGLSQAHPIDVRLANVVDLYLSNLRARASELQVGDKERTRNARVDFYRNYFIERWEFIGSPIPA